MRSAGIRLSEPASPPAAAASLGAHRRVRRGESGLTHVMCTPHPAAGPDAAGAHYLLAADRIAYIQVAAAGTPQRVGRLFKPARSPPPILVLLCARPQRLQTDSQLIL